MLDIRTKMAWRKLWMRGKSYLQLWAHAVADSFKFLADRGLRITPLAMNWGTMQFSNGSVIKWTCLANFLDKPSDWFKGGKISETDDCWVKFLKFDLISTRNLPHDPVCWGKDCNVLLDGTWPILTAGSANPSMSLFLCTLARLITLKFLVPGIRRFVSQKKSLLTILSVVEDSIAIQIHVCLGSISCVSE